MRIDILDSSVVQEVPFWKRPEDRDEVREAASEEELVEILKLIFGTKRTRSIIKSILAQLGIKVGSSATQPDAA